MTNRSLLCDMASEEEPTNVVHQWEAWIFFLGVGDGLLIIFLYSLSFEFMFFN